MLLSNKIVLLLKALGALVFITLALSACTFSPIYGDKNINNNNFQLSYAKPTTRLEQIVYSDLKLKLGEVTNIDAQNLKITISQSTRSVGRSSDGLPTNVLEIKLTANIKLFENAEQKNVVFSAMRVSTASYRTNGQAFADQQAAISASETAALELAQIIRLTLIAQLKNPN